MTEKIFRIDYNFTPAGGYQCFEVPTNCISITEINREWCKVILEIEINGVMEREAHEVTNINHKYFKLK